MLIQHFKISRTEPEALGSHFRIKLLPKILENFIEVEIKQAQDCSSAFVKMTEKKGIFFTIFSLLFAEMPFACL